MDNLCHTLAGALLGEAGLKRRTALAMPTLLVGANLPDIDAVTVLTGGALVFRRGWTHGVLAMLVLPLLLAGAMLAWDRWVRRRRGAAPAAPVRPRQLLLLAYLAVLSHPLLDWLNTYGVRLLMPFDRRWFYGDSLFIIDPWMWLVLGFGVLLARRLGQVRPAHAALLLAGLYLLGMVGSAAAGRAAVRSALRDAGLDGPVSVMVGPVPLDPFRRQVVVAGRDAYRTGTLIWAPRPRLRLDGRSIPKNHDLPAARQAAATGEGRAFLVWSRFPFYVIEERPDGTVVRIDDARYAGGRRPSFASVSVRLDPARP